MVSIYEYTKLKNNIKTVNILEYFNGTIDTILKIYIILIKYVRFNL